MASEPFLVYQPTRSALPFDKDTSTGSEEEPLVKEGKSGREGKKRKRGARVLASGNVAVVNVAAGLDGCDDQLLPATFRALEADLGFHPTLLGYISLVQTMSLSIMCPFWGYMSDKHSRKWLLCFGTIAWGLATIALGLVSTFWQVMLLRAMNGMFLGSVGPISQSILADASPPKDLGFAFGMVQLSSSLGRLLGGVVTTTVALMNAGALRGWRVSFLCVGGLSILLGAVIALFLDEIPRSRWRRRKAVVDDSGGTGSAQPEVKSDWLTFVKELVALSLFRKSVLILLAEGVIGSIPWSAFSFNTMFFQYAGMSDAQAALLTGALLIGAAVGGVVGGWLGDRLYEKWPRHGRAALGQFAILIRLPLLALGYLVVPRNPEYFTAYLFLGLGIGLSSMAGVAVNRPIISDVVMPNHRATIFAITISVEGSSAALFGATLVGILAESVFGYQKTDLLVSKMSPELRNGNANALALSLSCLTIAPWILSFFLYGLLHFTYADDKEALKEMVTELEGEADDGVDVSEVRTTTEGHVSETLETPPENDEEPAAQLIAEEESSAGESPAINDGTFSGTTSADR